ncbi:MAG: EAL domain-containing protein [Pseudomonadota bacterium]
MHEITAPLAHILVCDDEQPVLGSTCALLRAQGYAVTAARNGAEALARINASVDLLLLDLNMPVLDGYQVLDALQKTESDLAVIVVSGEDSVDGAVSCLRLGAQDYLRKPYVPQELFARVTTALRERRLMRENRVMQQQLAESEQLHRFFVESAPDLIYLLNAEGRFAYTNQRIEKLLGYHRDELLGQHYKTLVHPDDHAQADLFLLQLSDGSQPRQETELRLLHKDSAEGARPFETYSLPVQLNSTLLAGTGTFGVARDISERRRAEEIIRFQSSHDLLTRLPNRALFKDRIALALTQAQRDGRALAVMYIDLDRFKLVNDSLGHLVGDELLQIVSLRMKELLREGDTLARVGGDEFLLLLPGVESNEAALLVANKLIEELERPFHIAEHQLYLTASIGIVRHPQDGVTADVLIHRADTAMYAVKRRGRNGCGFFSPEMESVPKHRLTLANDLHNAVASGQMRLHYQPQVDVRTGLICGVEALVRWQHPVMGLLPPSEFLHIAEEAGLSTGLGEWVLKTACEDMQRWRHLGCGEIRLAVNFSASQVEQANFVAMVQDTLKRSGLPNRVLEIELTEESLIKDIGVVVRKLAMLADSGVRVAIDDFGVGYSSLSYLRKLPIHTLKIDRSFVQDIRSGRDLGSLVSAIVSMAAGLMLNSVAEGVETDTQVDFLQRLGCYEMQGFRFSRAVDADATSDMLRTQPFVQQLAKAA